MTVQEFADMYEAVQRAEIERRHGPDHIYLHDEGQGGTGLRAQARVYVIPGPKFTKVDFGGSGRLMIENATGAIFGIKGYGRVHRGHAYGTLETVGEWDWSGYYPARRVGVSS